MFFFSRPCDTHGFVSLTNSRSLPLLGQTRAALPVSQLVFEHQLAPVSGELVHTITGVSADAGVTFEELTYASSYRIKCLAGHYGTYRRDQTSELPRLRSSLDHLIAGGLSHLLGFVIQVLRAKQLGVIPADQALCNGSEYEVYAERINQLRNEINQSLQMVFLLCFYFNCNDEYHYRYDAERDAAIGAFLQSAQQRLPHNFSSLDQGVQLQLATVIHTELCRKFLDIAPWCKLEQNKQGPYFGQSDCEFKAWSRDLRTMFEFAMVGEQLNQHLFSLLTSQRRLNPNSNSVPLISANNYQQRVNEFNKEIASINARIDFLLATIAGKTGRIVPELIAKQNSVHYPVALFLPASYKNKLDDLGREFRSNQPLVLGWDIQYMAVNEENLEDFLDFLHKYDLFNAITVLDMETLQPFVITTAQKLKAAVANQAYNLAARLLG